VNPWRQAWSRRAACLNMDVDRFYPDRGESTREAKKVCARCPVTAECLDWAVSTKERYGVWGGLSERERRRLKLERRVA
jgi:WhiB family redox-sensing transcriptional regulator